MRGFRNVKQRCDFIIFYAWHLKPYLGLHTITRLKATKHKATRGGEVGVAIKLWTRFVPLCHITARLCTYKGPDRGVRFSSCLTRRISVEFSRYKLCVEFTWNTRTRSPTRSPRSPGNTWALFIVVLHLNFTTLPSGRVGVTATEKPHLFMRATRRATDRLTDHKQCTKQFPNSRIRILPFLETSVMAVSGRLTTFLDRF